MNLIYITPADDPESAILTAMDIYVASGMQPKIISDGITSITFNTNHAIAVCNGYMNIDEYVEKHKLD